MTAALHLASTGCWVLILGFTAGITKPHHLFLPYPSLTLPQPPLPPTLFSLSAPPLIYALIFWLARPALPLAHLGPAAPATHCRCPSLPLPVMIHPSHCHQFTGLRFHERLHLVNVAAGYLLKLRQLETAAFVAVDGGGGGNTMNQIVWPRPLHHCSHPAPHTPPSCTGRKWNHQTIRLSKVCIWCRKFFKSKIPTKPGTLY